MTVRQRRALGYGIFLIIAFGGSWACWIPLVVSGQTVVPGRGWPSHLPGLLAPALGAIVAVALLDGPTGLRDLTTRSTRWRRSRLTTAILALCLLAAGVAVLVGAGSGAPLAYTGAPLWGAGVVVYVLIVNGFGEEIGWRGYLGDRLLADHSPGSVAVIVWAVWGLWHLPLFFLVRNFRDLGAGGTVGWAAGLLSGSIVLLWLYRATGHSVLYVALWHTAFNFATTASPDAGTMAAVVSTVVIAASIPLMLRRSWWRRGAPTPPVTR